MKDDSSSYKTLWFPEKPTLGFSSTTNPAINAKSLVELRPFASLNVGSSDSFNFLNQPVSAEWLKILGVKYMFFPRILENLYFQRKNKTRGKDFLIIFQKTNLSKELIGIQRCLFLKLLIIDKIF